MRLWSYAALAGSVSVLAGGLVSLLAPRPYGWVVWVAVSVVLCTWAGWVADRFVA